MRAGFYAGPRLYAAPRMRARRVRGVRALGLVMARVHTFFVLRCPREWPSSACVRACVRVCVWLVRLARSVRRKGTRNWEASPDPQP